MCIESVRAFGSAGSSGTLIADGLAIGRNYTTAGGRMVAEGLSQPRLFPEQAHQRDQRQSRVEQLRIGCGLGKAKLFSPSTQPVLLVRFRNAEQFDDAGRRQGG
jgi:hypothetical protein